MSIDLGTYRNRLDGLKSVYNQRLGAFQQIQQKKQILTQRGIDLEYKYNTDTLSRSVLDALSKTTEHEVKTYIEPLITEALQVVFGYNLKFGLYFQFERNQVMVKFSLTDSLGNVADGDLEDIKGGGILDVVSIVLQFALVELFNIKGPIILDEPGKFVDQSHQVTLGQLILSFAEKFHRQIIIVTHDDGICAIGTKHYNVALDNTNTSKVTLIKEGTEA